MMIITQKNYSIVIYMMNSTHFDLPTH